ncbi:MAG: hypothetical protein WCF67_06035, partial [Chitinophagaceae bacterium]
VEVLVIVGTLNGFILPVALALMLLAVHKKNLMRGYKYSTVLQIIGWIVVLILSWMVVKTIVSF